MTLVDVPDLVRDECAHGLRLRSSLQCPSKKRAVDFAQHVAVGGLVTLEQVGLVIAAHRIIEAKEREEGLDLCRSTVTYRLWGGDSGRAWAEGMISPEPILGALAGDDTPRIEGVSQRLAAIDRRAADRLTELVEVGFASVLDRLAGLASNRLKRPSAPMLSALGSHARRDEVLAGMGAVARPDALLAVPLPILALLGLDDQEMIRQSLDRALEGRADRIIEDAQYEAIDALVENEIISSARAVELRTEADDHRAEALALLLALLLGLAAARANGRNPIEGAIEGESMSGRVPRSVVAGVLATAGGALMGAAIASGQLVERTTIVGPLGTLTAGVGVTDGPMILRAVAQASPDVLGFPLPSATIRTKLVTVTRWRLGRPVNPFEPHRQLGARGVSWTTDDERDAACAKAIESFPRGNRVYFPGDHAGCQCWLETEVRAVSDNGSVRIAL